jgi:hypothetical protein
MSVKSATAFGLSSGLEPGLVLLGTQSFSGVGSFSLPADTFTSTYRNYRVHLIVTAVSTNLNFTARMRVSGTDNTTSNYSNGFVGRTNNASTFTGNQDNFSAWEFGGSDVGQQGPKFALDFIDPQQTSKTFFTGTMVGSGTTATGFGGAVIGGFHNTTTSFDSFTLIASTGNISGYARVYAYSE